MTALDTHVLVRYLSSECYLGRGNRAGRSLADADL